MERLFQILAVILAGVAAYFFWQGNNDGAFIATVFGAVSFFLSIRFQVKVRLDQRAAEKAKEEKRRREAAEIDDSEPPQLNEIPANEQIGSEHLRTDHEQKI
jgi:hypothetical protein